MIYLPGSGIIAAYIDPTTNAIMPEFNQAISMFLWVWFIITVIYTIAAMRSTWVLLLDLICLDICLLLLACGFMLGTNGLFTAGYAFGLIVCFLSCEYFLRSLQLYRPLSRMCTDLDAFIQSGPPVQGCGQALLRSLCQHSRCSPTFRGSLTKEYTRGFDWSPSSSSMSSCHLNAMLLVSIDCIVLRLIN